MNPVSQVGRVIPNAPLKTFAPPENGGLRISRPTFFAFVTLLISTPAFAAEVDFNFVRELAIKRAAEPYHAPNEELPPRLASLSYDDARKIAFEPKNALWCPEDLPFRVQFVPRGGLFRAEVVMNEIDRGSAHRLAFDPANFQLRDVPGLTALPADLGYVGFSVYSKQIRPGEFGEAISFLGASYFRALATGQSYGLSARGLALDSGVDGRPEEFPRFAEFWLRRPDAHARELIIFALLDSPSVAGAFEFRINPGERTFVDTKASFAFRETGKLPGFAPLTSMFWYGENGKPPEHEKRPEVHDSDGLFVRDKTGAACWVPLQNARALRTYEIPVSALQCFGLAQRDRRPESYLDTEAHYDKRPTAWIEPRNDWGAGKVRLVELTANKEYADNIVAYWVPDRLPERGQPVDLSYRLGWSMAEPPDASLAQVTATREEGRREHRVTYAVDFADSRAKHRDAAALVAEATASEGAKIVTRRVHPNPEAAGWRATLEVELTTPGKPVQLECCLRQGREPISETWRYRVEE
jgi:glucans biosynthesis protein